MTHHRLDNRNLSLSARESRDREERVYRCDGPFCPGLPYSPAQVRHPRSCRVPFEGAD